MWPWSETNVKFDQAWKGCRSGSISRTYSRAARSWANDDGVTSCHRPELASTASPLCWHTSSSGAHTIHAVHAGAAGDWR